jgi:hypothetical protein
VGGRAVYFRLSPLAGSSCALLSSFCATSPLHPFCKIRALFDTYLLHEAGLISNAERCRIPSLRRPKQAGDG